MEKLKPVDVLIIGSGLAGMSAALECARRAPGKSLLLCTKSGRLEGGSTYISQGGIASALNRKDIRRHYRDTLAAGSGLCDKKAVRRLVSPGARAAGYLSEMGVPLDRDESGVPLCNREGGHAAARILRSSGDGIGRALSVTLAGKVCGMGIPVRTSCMLYSLHLVNGRAAGAFLLGAEGLQYQSAASIIIATGGWGNVFGRTTNPAETTGDALRIASGLGMEIRDMAFMQFHPTALRTEGDHLPLLSEALRGAGAVLLDAGGAPLFSRKEENLGTRDTVARKVWKEMRREGAAWLDCRMIPGFAARFPGIDNICREAGFDPLHQPLPITPAAHYAIGGIAAAPDGRTGIEGVRVVGEAACTGVHGANRLASNSLLECLIFSRLAASAALREWSKPDPGVHPPAAPAPERLPADSSAARRIIGEVHRISGSCLGIVRSGNGMRTALKELGEERDRLPLLRPLKGEDPDSIRIRSEAASLLNAAILCAGDALSRKAPVGVHYVEQ